MNLVGAYDSSDEEELPPPPPPQQQKQQQQQQQRQQHHRTTPTTEVYQHQHLKGIAKGKAATAATAVTAPAPAPAPASPATTKQARDTSNKRNRKSESKAKKAKKKKKKAKTVNALVLSPEIQAALARGDTLGDSDSDEAPEKKPPKIVRPVEGNPNDLLSLLPQPSTTASADDILLKSRHKRREAAAAKAVKAAAPQAIVATKGKEKPSRHGVESEAGGGHQTSTATAPATSGGGRGMEDQNGNETGDDSESDGDGDDLLASMRSQAAASGGGSNPLFTLPSRAKPPPLPGAGDRLPVVESGESADRSVDVGAMPMGGNGEAPLNFQAAGAPEQSLGQWGGTVQGLVGISPQGVEGATYAGQAGAVPSATEPQHGMYQYGAAFQQQQQQTPYYYGAAQAASSGAVQGADAGHEEDFGSAGGKASRRKGRDMERALARGDLGALGSETPVMDLHQGSNEFNPLRTKPITAAMKQDQKHIEGSVYDPRTGTTVKTLEPTSMQKRKHQINQLAVQAASMERDLMERSGASRLTKAQTHAKYGW